ncbi:hypothetical protein C8035_v007087 [Colletotrichum spinosum]|uniref:Uncharacterized protein n=1 Tax=Colletotrichum spinosum TaxID=1347390 RepID=A0A4R8PTE4_9PEZI|nr:hypothetical protein C8035_v007087 [Colletotrichum spinosum]
MGKYYDKHRLRGERILGEIREASIEKVVDNVVADHFRPQPLPAFMRVTKRPKFYPIPRLNALAAKHFRATREIPLTVTGRYLPLVYRLVAGLVAPPHRKAVLVVDTEHRFDVTRLACSADDVRHIYVLRPALSRTARPGNVATRSINVTPDQVRQLLSQMENFILYGKHQSGNRDWWGAVVVGAVGGGDIIAAWKGWLTVERVPVPGFNKGSTIRQAMAERQRRQQDVDDAPWNASSRWGAFAFTESLPTNVVTTYASS